MGGYLLHGRPRKPHQGLQYATVVRHLDALRLSRPKDAVAREWSKPYSLARPQRNPSFQKRDEGNSGTPEIKASEAKPNLEKIFRVPQSGTPGGTVPAFHAYVQGGNVGVKSSSPPATSSEAMAAVTYGPLVVGSHAKCGYLTVPLVFGDFPVVVGSPYFLGVVPAVQATPRAAPKATGIRGIKPHSSQGRVFSVNTISCVTVPRKRGQRQGRRGSKPRAIVSNSGKTVLVRDIRVRLDGGEPILPRDRSVPTVATSNKFAPLQGMRQENRDSPKGARQGQASSSAPQQPRKMRQMWVTKKEARRIKQAKAGQPAEGPERQCLSEKKLRTPNLLALTDRKGGASTGSPTSSPPTQNLLKEETQVTLKLPHQGSQSLKG
ncbi:hypothetical protein Taro_018410 [Colocasia esculenta]|uniref:Uncharacterized protein n=1 Tax=Colocasia esculenta TaxID=4460 RepID=A0A843UQX5_COLES|nr:hypothetical protein [Colocasia esculenta]